MGIYIKGMEMPQNCCDCFMDMFKCLMGKSEMPVERMARERHPKCPLIPVPPHGRLIDADDLVNGLIYPYEQFERAFRELIGDCTTIIERTI